MSFRNRLQNLILKYSESLDGPVGLYAERELPRMEDSEEEQPLFLESKTAPQRAFGSGPAPVSTGGDVGSEGIIAQLISELCRRDASKFLSHPGPDAIRLKEVLQTRQREYSGRRSYRISGLELGLAMVAGRWA
jgi:hypothetical protein